MKILLLSNPVRPLAAGDRRDLRRLLRGHTVLERDTPRGASPRRAPWADLIIAVGGDGAVLAAARLTRGQGLPIVGLNSGHLGFLAGLTPDNFRQELPHILAGRYLAEDRVALRVELPGGRSGWAINDVGFQATTRDLFAAALRINGKPVCDYRGDGLIVSSATGSTAYNLSLGGPLLAPDSEMIVVTPKAPLALTNRSLVTNAPRAMVFEVAGGPTRVEADSIPVGIVRRGDRVCIHRSPVTVPLIFPANHNHYAAVGDKLHWQRQEISR